MIETPQKYASMVSPRSQRLRTIGWVMLAFIIGLFLYGYFGLMPVIGNSMSSQSHTPATISSQSNPPHLSAKAKKIVKIKAAIGILYWGVEFLLVTALVFVAWLDVREVSKTYLRQRKTIWAESVEIGQEDVEAEKRASGVND